MADLGVFRDLISLVQRNGLEPVIDSEYLLDDVHGALERLASRVQLGGGVVNIGGGT